MKLNFSKSFVANSVTSMNIFCGFLSLVFASHNDFMLAAIFIMIAAIFDALDGIVARLLGTSSKFGVELDSLSDVVSFGAAPSFLIYKAFAFQFGVVGVLLSSMLLIFGALRLARFNISIQDINTKADFTGLPIPLSAITISLLIFSFYKDGKIIEPINYLIFPLVILLSILMVSKIRYNALPKLKEKTVKQKLIYIMFLLISIFLIILSEGAIAFFIFLAIILFGIVRAIYNKIFDTKNKIHELKIREN
ncbi:MAG: CDP-diacylglycerol--serine O-phosphatidyltransferase [Melioribacteraceae bacterium]|nr:CDP-diacylglycerol--serine O-phosphatidyltransferase [Melioribacteraceae bacterium]